MINILKPLKKKSEGAVLINNFSYQIVLNKLIIFLLAFSLFIIPLSFASFFLTVHIFDLHKISILRVLIILITFFTVWREILKPSIFWKNFKIIFRKYYLFPFIFIFLFGLSVLFSDNISLSFFGTIDRQQGYQSYLLYFLWFLLFSFNLFHFILENNKDVSDNLNQEDKSLFFNNKNNFYKHLRIYIFAIVFSAFLSALYGVCQFLGIDFYYWSEPASLTGRAFSTLGQPNFFASWLLLSLPLAIILIFKSSPGLFRIFYSLASLIILLGILLSASRAAWLAFIFIAFIFLLKILFNSQINKKKKILLAIFLVMLSFSSLLIMEKILPGRISQALNFSSGSSSARVDFYGSAVKSISQKPIFGYGQENLKDEYLSHYQADWGTHSDVNQSPDRVHNLFLDILMSGGIVAFIAFFCLYFYFFSLSKNKKQYFFARDLKTALSLGVIAYLFSLLFGFSIPSGEFYFFSFLAILAAINFYELINGNSSEKINIFKNSSEKIKSFANKFFLRIFLIIFSILLSVFLIYRALTPIFSDFYLAEAMTSFHSYDYAKMAVLLDYSRELPLNPVWRSDQARIYSEALIPLHPYKSEKVSEFFIAENLLIANQDLRDKGFNNILLKAKIENAFGNKEVAEKYFLEILEKVKNWPKINIEMGKFYSSKKEYDKAIDFFMNALSGLPNLADENMNEGHRKIARSFYHDINIYLAETYIMIGDFEKAEHYYRTAYSYNPMDFLIFKSISDLYYIQGDYEKALIEIGNGFRLSPNDYTWPLLYSYLYEELGNYKEAEKWKNEALRLGFVEEGENNNSLLTE